MRNDRVVDFQQQRRTLNDCAFRVDLSLARSVHGDLRIPMGKLSDCSATRKGVQVPKYPRNRSSFLFFLKRNKDYKFLLCNERQLRGKSGMWK